MSIPYGWWANGNKKLVEAVTACVEVRVEVSPKGILDILDCLNDEELLYLVCELLARHGTDFSVKVMDNIKEAIE